jgi:hypothetical protein
MSQRIHVVAAEGRAVPMEGVSGTIGSDPVAVIDSHYYRRRVREGDLRVVASPAETVSVADTSASAGHAAPMGSAGQGDDASAPGADDAHPRAESAASEQNPTTSRRRATP